MNKFTQHIFTTTLTLLLMLAWGIAARAQTQTQTFNNPANNGQPANQFTVPAGVTSVTVECWGGGGKGGSTGWAFNQEITRGGGGGGAYARKVISVVPNTTYNVNVGAGSTNTDAGLSSWFINSTTILAVGGASNQDNNTGAAGGLENNCIGDVRNSGGSGANGNAGSDYSGGGGSSADNASDGTTATNQNGATAPANGGNGGNGRSLSSGAGTSGSQPGGGGGGAYANGWVFTNHSGGNGAHGQVIITYTVCPTITSSVSGQSNISCHAGDDGTITITASGGTAPYQFSINNGATYVTGSNPYTFSGLTAGTYYPRVKDANGCESPICE